MGKRIFDRIIKTLAISIVVLFIATLTAGAVSAGSFETGITIYQNAYHKEYNLKFNQGMEQAKADNATKHIIDPDEGQELKEAIDFVNTDYVQNNDIDQLRTDAQGDADEDGFDDGYNRYIDQHTP